MKIFEIHINDIHDDVFHSKKHVWTQYKITENKIELYFI